MTRSVLRELDQITWPIAEQVSKMPAKERSALMWQDF